MRKEMEDLQQWSEWDVSLDKLQPEQIEPVLRKALEDCWLRPSIERKTPNGRFWDALSYARKEKLFGVQPLSWPYRMTIVFEPEGDGTRIQFSVGRGLTGAANDVSGKSEAVQMVVRVINRMHDLLGLERPRSTQEFVYADHARDADDKGMIYALSGSSVPRVLYHPDDERSRFSFMAFLFGPLWLLWHEFWKPAINFFLLWVAIIWGSGEIWARFAPSTMQDVNLLRRGLWLLLSCWCAIAGPRYHQLRYGRWPRWTFPLAMRKRDRSARKNTDAQRTDAQ